MLTYRIKSLTRVTQLPIKFRAGFPSEYFKKSIFAFPLVPYRHPLSLCLQSFTCQCTGKVRSAEMLISPEWPLVDQYSSSLAFQSDCHDEIYTEPQRVPRRIQLQLPPTTIHLCILYRLPSFPNLTPPLCFLGSLPPINYFHLNFYLQIHS